MLIAPAQVALGGGVAAVGGLPVQEDRALRVGGHPVAVFMADPQQALALRVAAGGGPVQQRHRRRFVHRRAPAGQQPPGLLAQAGRVAGLGPAPAEGIGVGLAAVPVGFPAQPQPALGGHLALLRLHKKGPAAQRAAVGLRVLGHILAVGRLAAVQLQRHNLRPLLQSFPPLYHASRRNGRTAPPRPGAAKAAACAFLAAFGGSPSCGKRRGGGAVYCLHSAAECATQ